MKLSHVLAAAAALASFSVFAAEQATKNQEPQSASGGATQQQSEKAGGQQMSQDKELVKQAQEKLSAAGHDVGKADGILGPKTQKGLKDFQQSKGLEPSGQLDQKTLSALGVSESSASTGATSSKSTGSSSASPAATEKSK